MCHHSPANPHVRAAAKYGVQRVWDSKERYHSFFEMPVSEGTGELGPQMTCLRREKESREEEREEGTGKGKQGEEGAVEGEDSGGDRGEDDGEDIGNHGDHRGGGGGDDGEVELENAAAPPWFPDIDELFGFDAKADGGRGGVSPAAASAAAERLRCPGGAAAWRAMRSRRGRPSSTLARPLIRSTRG